MATYYRMFDIGRQFFDANGDPANGQQLFVYAAGTTTKATVYKDNAGAASHTNPIVLESDGTIPDEEVWAPTGTYKFVLAPSDDTDPPASGLTLHDNVKPINDTGADSVSEWVASGLTPTRVDGTSFTVVGDQTSTLHVGRRLRITDSGTVYGTIVDSSFSSPNTTITVELDSGTIDSSLSAFDYGIVSFVNPSVEYPPVQFTGTALCPHQGLIIQQITTSTVDVDADNLVLTHETTSQQRTFASINLTADITASGANGLDTGSEASSTWYHIWVIAQPDGTTASLLSTSATAPTMPSGYVFKGYVGAIFNRSTGDLLDMYQTGITVVQVPDYALPYTTVGTSTRTVTLRIPTTAREAHVNVRADKTSGNTGQAVVYVSAFDEGTSGRGVHIFARNLGAEAGALGIWSNSWVPIATARTVYVWAANANDNGSVGCYGWRY